MQLSSARLSSHQCHNVSHNLEQRLYSPCECDHDRYEGLEWLTDAFQSRVGFEHQLVHDSKSYCHDQSWTGTTNAVNKSHAWHHGSDGIIQQVPWGPNTCAITIPGDGWHSSHLTHWHLQRWKKQFEIWHIFFSFDCPDMHTVFTCLYAICQSLYIYFMGIIMLS